MTPQPNLKLSGVKRMKQKLEQNFKTQFLKARCRRWYIQWIRPHILREINKQRLKLIWDVWGYLPLLSIRALQLKDRLRLVRRFLIIDWYVGHAHKPGEISGICRALADRPARSGEIVLEAGCWQGGSSAKFSIICSMLGYRLSIYDSFEGVEEMETEEKLSGYDFSGKYKAPERVLRKNLALYGETGVCSIRKGWFANTLAIGPVPYRVRLAYIDCDLAKSTREALAGIVPALVDDGWIFSQDFHIRSVQKLLSDPDTWSRFGKGVLTITRQSNMLASIRFS
jgi:O-methyltransferase